MVEIVGTVGGTASVSGTVGSVPQVAGAVGGSESLAAEVDMTRFSSEERQKLQSVEWGATRNSSPFVRLAYAAEKGTGGGGDAGGGVGDSTQWTGTSAFQEVVRIYIPQPSWRANGYIEWDVTAAFAQPSGVAAGTETVTFKIARAVPPVTLPGTDSSVFGLPTALVDVSGLSWTSGALAVGPGTGAFTFLFRLRAGGHQGTTYRQAMSGEMLWHNLTTGVTDRKPHTARCAIDTTEDVELALLFKCDYTPGVGQSFNVTSASAVGLFSDAGRFNYH